MASVTFQWDPAGGLTAQAESLRAGLRLSDIVLERNARWFITIRWVVVAALVLIQAAILCAHGLLARIGILATGWWPSAIAGLLASSNVLFMVLLLSPRLRKLAPLSANLWAQIAVDLICVTALVHYCGSIATPAPFLYVLHIVLSCVFFSVRSSFIVVCMAIVFYTASVAADLTAFFSHHSIFAALIGPHPLLGPAASTCWAVALSMIFIAVWYLVSQLSLVIRTRESQLVAAYEHIQRVQKEKDRYAVQMTHQLKAPLDAIRSNTALILGGYSSGVTDDMHDLLARIDKRAQGMAGLIMDVLKLARVKDSPDHAATRQRSDIGIILGRCVETLGPVAAAHGVTIEANVKSWETECVPDQIEMLFENIISNAIAYSHTGQTVTIMGAGDTGKGTTAFTVADKGIGIDAESLPHIFDEYFRAPDAARHNSSSSGIGLAIVKAVAQSHGLYITVDSAIGDGTLVTVEFPSPVHARAGAAA